MPVATKGRIVVIDDHDSTLDFFGEALTCLGYTPLLAQDGPKGLELCRENEVQAVLVDYVMPEMSGLEVADRVKAFSKPLTVILTSASYQDAAQDIESKRIDYFLNKPFRMAELESILEEALGQEAE
ncbi:MAG: response regulator [Nitrospirae bacterium]|nr:response regulator [Candidatus Manganitrophaceae bacterium]